MSNETKKRVMHETEPTEPGFYWCAYDEHSTPDVVEVYRRRTGICFFGSNRPLGAYPYSYWSDRIDEWVMPKAEG